MVITWLLQLLAFSDHVEDLRKKYDLFNAIINQLIDEGVNRA